MARRNTRIDSHGALVPLEEQDRARWDHTQIEEGLDLLESALRLRSIGPYQLQAAIAAVHAQARTAGETDWREISALYQELARLAPSPVIALNHAVAVAMCEGLEAGLALVDRAGSSGELDEYYLFHAARADILRRLERSEESIEAYRRALALVSNSVERDYLDRRLKSLSPRSS